MNKEIYFKKLRKIIHVLPEDELERILAFYREIVEDKIENGTSEEQAIAELGDVYTLAQKILVENPNRRPVNWKKAVGIGVASVFAVFVFCSAVIAVAGGFFRGAAAYSTDEVSGAFQEEVQGSIEGSIDEVMDDMQSFIDEAQKTVPEGAERKTESISAKGIKQINLDTEKKCAIFKSADIEDIQVAYDTNSKQVYEVNSQNDVLTIKNRLKDRNHWRNWYGDTIGKQEKYCIIVTLPNSYKGDISLQGADGFVSAENVKGIEKFICKSNSSAVALNNFQAADVQVDSGTGAVKLDNVEASNSVSLQANTGAIAFESLLSPNITLDTNVGAITGSIKGKEEDYKIHREIDLGSSNLNEKSTGSKNLKVKTNVGAVKITFEE